jgi:hypothetical protein
MTGAAEGAPLPPQSEKELRALLGAVEGAWNSPVVSRAEFPNTGARRQRNEARCLAWLALDRERDWLRWALAVWPRRLAIPYEPAPRTGLVAEALCNPLRRTK